MPGAGRESAKSRRLRKSLPKAQREAELVRLMRPLLTHAPRAWPAMFRAEIIPRLNKVFPTTRFCLECGKPLGFARHGRRKYHSTKCADLARARARRSRLRLRNKQARLRQGGAVSFDESRDSVIDAFFDEFDSDKMITLIAALCERHGERQRAAGLRKLLRDDSR